ncbi:hypothetical protein [Chelatococcus asaccharovorans]|nr:hypothetical protein [Chelatococcus asaccharovorans]
MTRLAVAQMPTFFRIGTGGTGLAMIAPILLLQWRRRSEMLTAHEQT